MTQTPAPLPAPLRLPVPQDHVLFQRLSTDFYPWTEVTTQLDTLQEQQATAVLDVQQQGRWARFIWVRGQLHGGMAASGSEVTLAATMRALPQALVTLVQTEPLVAEVLWDCRHTPPRPLELSWPEARAQLERERFQGALISGPHCSYWEGGRVMTGSLPQAGASCQTLSSSNQLNRDTLLRVWSEVIGMTLRARPAFDDVWKQTAMQLSSRYPVLDPFAGEIVVNHGILMVEDDVPMQEFRPAMLAAYRVVLRRLNLNLDDLPLAHLRQRPDWAAAGLETL